MRRLIARYAVEHPEAFELVTLFDDGRESRMLDKNDPTAQSIAFTHPAAIWFERKISDDFGIRFPDAFDRRPLLHHERFAKGVHPMRKDFAAQSLDFAEFVPYKYEAIGGEGVFEVAVGPIHAGIIEPGHFQFSQAGEDILHLEVRHFYKYRGIEKMLEGKTLQEAKPIVERISGNESVAYQIAWREILAQAGGVELSAALRKRHALLLELERLIHHLTDLGFIPNDAGFGAALAFCSQRAEEARRMMATLTGHRFGFGAVDFAAPPLEGEALRRWIGTMRESMEWFAEWIVDIPSLWDRFDTTGILKKHKAIKYDTVGVVARASGLALDRRLGDALYEAEGFEIATQTSGDVAARFKVRLAEVFESLRLMERFIEEEALQEQAPKTLQDGRYDTFVESSLGELFMSVDLEEGRIARFFVRDPSFVNWQALHLMMPGNIIADFPLINKSCDLSYAGNDL